MGRQRNCGIEMVRTARYRIIAGRVSRKPIGKVSIGRRNKMSMCYIITWQLKVLNGVNIVSNWMCDFLCCSKNSKHSKGRNQNDNSSLWKENWSWNGKELNGRRRPSRCYICHAYTEFEHGYCSKMSGLWYKET